MGIIGQTVDKDVRREHFFRRRSANFIINAGSLESNTVDLRKGCETLVGLIFPATVAGATITFKSAPPDDNAPVAADLVDVYDDAGAQVEVTVTADAWVTISPSTFAGMRYIRLVTDVAAGQGGEVIQGVIRPV